MKATLRPPNLVWCLVHELDESSAPEQLVEILVQRRQANVLGDATPHPEDVRGRGHRPHSIAAPPVRRHQPVRALP